MNQKVSVYLKKGEVAAKGALKHNPITFLKYCLYMVTSFFGKLFFLTYPLFALADIRIAKTTKEAWSFEIEKSFEDANSIKKVWTSMLFILVKMMIIFSGVFILSGITYLMIYLGHTIDSMTSLESNIMIYIFGVPGVLAILVFIISVNLYLGPAMYLIQTYDVGISEALSRSVSIMSKKGKASLLLIQIVYFLRLALGIVLGPILIHFMKPTFLPVVLIFFVIILIIIILLILPKLLLSRQVALVSLFEDLTNEVDFNMIKKDVTKEDLLLSLFNEIGAEAETLDNEAIKSEEL